MANLKDLIVNGSARIIGNLYATLKGNADTATKLETSRTIRTNLSSTNAVGFDGSANITPGIQGTLGVANGGTGQTSVANIQAGKDGNGNTISSTYLKNADQGDMLPNFDAMTVLQTIEFNTSDSNWHTICTRNNTETNPKDVVDCVYFRITVTGTNINHVADCAWIMKGQANSNPMLLINYMPGTSDAAYCGFRYIREIYPKALNNGYKWALEVLQNRNNNARHYKIQVFKTNSNYTWTQGTTSTFNSTYHNAAQYSAETTSGYFISYLNGTVGQASNAGGLNDRLNKVFNTNFPAGAAILVNQFIYMNNNKHYPATNKTKAIEPGYGIQFTSTAYNANTDVGWDRIRQKQRITSLTNIPHATLARGNPCYFRCTMDANGNILSDNYVATSMANGYTWYYVGIAESTTAIALDTTQSFFITLDSNGKLTHINGKALDADTSDCAKLSDFDVIHTVIETYQNGTDWYRIYDDGWVEQGGRTSLNEISTVTITYLKPFFNTNYCLLAVQTTQSTASDTEVGIQFTPTSTTQGILSCHYINPNTTEVSWYACGQGA